MKGFIVKSIDVSLSRVYTDTIQISETETVDGQKYRHAVAVVKFVSSGDVDEVTGEDLVLAITEKLGRLIEVEK